MVVVEESRPARRARAERPRGERTRTLIAGIDEAGLGPMLGPLAIGWCVFEVPARDSDPWSLLSRVVACEPRRAGGRIVVADSKRVFQRNAAGERRLELTALAFAALARPGGAPPREARELLFGALRPSEPYLAAPWYHALPRLPRAHEASTLELAALRLGRALSAQRLGLVDLGVRVVPERELNDSFARTLNKATSTWELVLEVLAHLWNVHAAPELDVAVDALGGRVRYGALLARGLPDARVRLLVEEPGRSGYELVGPDPRMRVAFLSRGEERSFAVALASCLAKYARETVMDSFNAWFTRLQPGLRPTAGYVTDARRWLVEAEPALRAARLAPASLVRQR
jgi:hypothetical protein